MIIASLSKLNYPTAESVDIVTNDGVSGLIDSTDYLIEG